MNLIEMDGRNISKMMMRNGLLICASQVLEENEFYLKIEYRDGDMASVPMFFVIAEENGEEIQRWNYFEISGIFWSDRDWKPQTEEENKSYDGDVPF